MKPQPNPAVLAWLKAQMEKPSAFRVALAELLLTIEALP